MKIKNEIDLKNSNCNRFKGMLAKLQKRSVSVGIHKKDNRKYPKSEVTTADVANFLEFGTVKMPPRMFMRIFNVLTREKKELEEVIGTALNEQTTPDKVLEEIGGYQKERIKERILDNQVTPPSYNKSGITLVDSGQLVNSIDYEVH